ncbi:type II toxin-antitoxin system RelE/ParE family toxin [Sphingopyxis sp. H050]|uniref:type II toxin-antitoxin system RelE/ParE family toxin n=1 Tax=Sphingopyxis sp. H050 TaxID=1759072 RepID=UPI001E578086|nr:type II toxin-antitoxin system RelE/ParE family toxin [Sphingopyxis sp. H050]
MTAAIIWTTSARIDLARIDDYYSALDLEFADRAARNAVAAAHFLVENPFAGPIVDGTSYRKWRVTNSPFLLFYRIEKAAIRIVRIRHYREDWQTLP